MLRARRAARPSSVHLSLLFWSAGEAAASTETRAAKMFGYCRPPAKRSQTSDNKKNAGENLAVTCSFIHQVDKRRAMRII